MLSSMLTCHTHLLLKKMLWYGMWWYGRGFRSIGCTLTASESCALNSKIRRNDSILKLVSLEVENEKRKGKIRMYCTYFRIRRQCLRFVWACSHRRIGTYRYRRGYRSIGCTLTAYESCALNSKIRRNDSILKLVSLEEKVLSSGLPDISAGTQYVMSGFSWRLYRDCFLLSPIIVLLSWTMIFFFVVFVASWKS